MPGEEKHYGVFHTTEYDFDENLELTSVTRRYFNSYEDMIVYEKKFKEEHPDIAERREKGLEKMFKEMFKNVDILKYTEEKANELTINRST